jgi:hypothetical protein
VPLEKLKAASESTIEHRPLSAILVEHRFRDLTRTRIRNGVFRSVAQLEHAITDYFPHHNARPKLFVGTKEAGGLLEKIACRGWSASRSSRSEAFRSDSR